ncbi:hypothetical protein C9J03_16510 [Photobacterium gaetbulicola]|uniref:ExoP galactose-binding-like domain-containing protein n=1 Tax=Photobacterium gaetbulicola Gung47 TaxID=658445 RepID=A0A0C5WJJ5_9GAMM|nr:putative glycoside hydrolase [Photobacterium gaetbulicola]AJR05259.1 hypothetical protein H744_1c0233 [Photobacterium gaetbulicola Gung47]PSU06090.1 hypothetical protein C9J03_16510 [Photobacterium gaetbulicola]
MEVKMKYLALLTAAILSLSGCVEDAKDSNGSGNSGEVTNPDDGGDNSGGDNGSGNDEDLKLPREVAIYYPDAPDQEATSPYAIYLIDKDDNALAVSGDNNIVHGNITVAGETAIKEPLTVSITDDKAAIVFSSDGKGYDINAANGNENKNGTLQFKVKTNNFDVLNTADELNTVSLTMASGETKATIDITSAVSASINAEQSQLIRVPLTCFEEQGLDINAVDVAMSLETSGSIGYEFSDARIIANSITEKPGSNNVQGCLNNGDSIVLTEDTSVLAQSIYRGSAWVQEGQTKTISTTRGKAIQLNPGNSTDEGTIRYNGIHYTAANNWDPSSRSLLIFAIDLAKNLQDMAVSRLDLSHYMDGTLQLKYFMPTNAIDLPAGADTYLVIKMETPIVNATGETTGGYPSSESVFFNLTKAGVNKGQASDIELPIKDFFTNINGAVSFNALQYVEKLVTHIQQGGPDEAPVYSNLAEFKYGLADIKVVMPTHSPDTVTE